jgi:hypothetical protein
VQGRDLHLYPRNMEISWINLRSTSCG